MTLNGLNDHLLSLCVTVKTFMGILSSIRSAFIRNEADFSEICDFLFFVQTSTTCRATRVLFKKVTSIFDCLESFSFLVDKPNSATHCLLLSHTCVRALKKEYECVF